MKMNDMNKIRFYILSFLAKLANKNQAFRGTIHDLHILNFDEFEYNDVYNAVMDLINEKKILYIKDDDVYTLILKEKDMEEE